MFLYFNPKKINTGSFSFFKKAGIYLSNKLSFFKKSCDICGSKRALSHFPKSKIAFGCKGCRLFCRKSEVLCYFVHVLHVLL